MNKQEQKLLKAIYEEQKVTHKLASQMLESLNKVIELNNVPNKTRRRKKKDPNAPKGPRGPWILFNNHKREEYKKKFPDLTHQERMGKMKDDWNNKMSEKIKNRYRDAATKDKHRYQKEKLEYEAKKATEAQTTTTEDDNDDDSDDILDTTTKTTTKSKKKTASKAKKTNKPVATNNTEDSDDYSLDELSISSE